MQNFDVAIIRSNPITYDPRVIKISRSLSKKYRVIVLGWDRELSKVPYEVMDDKLHIKRFKFKAPYGRVGLLCFYPFFWIWVLINLFAFKPRAVHACDLDSLVPAYLFSAIFPTRVVFDSFDKYAMAFIPSRFYLVHRFVDMLEDKLASKADALVTVSEKRLLTFGKHKPKHFEVIANCPEDELANFQERIVPNSIDVLTLVYAGSLAKDRGLSVLSRALYDLNGVRLILAGRTDGDCIKQLLQNPNVEYVGLLKYEDALGLQASADVIPVLYDPCVPINRVASPNKLFEAMMLGVPVITNVCRDIVRDIKFGLTVSYNADQVRAAILRLKENPALRQNMGDRGRIAFKRTYNWSSMEKKLLKLYCTLLDVENGS